MLSLSLLAGQGSSQGGGDSDGSLGQTRSPELLMGREDNPTQRAWEQVGQRCHSRGPRKGPRMLK